MSSVGPTAERKDERLERAVDVAGRLLDNIEIAIRGKRAEVQLVLAALACKGHVLFEDVPGTAKTVLARAIAQSIEGAEPSRIQCTPDLQPTDVTGLSIWNQQARDFEFRAGPIFANVVLVDEINRAMPKTQSALLEAMAERQVTIDGVTRELSEPFIVLATQNPIELEGTFPLPEAQLDRFLLRVKLGYPDEREELRILQTRPAERTLPREPLADRPPLRELRDAIASIGLEQPVRAYVVALARATRDHPELSVGASPRAVEQMGDAARAFAMLDGRDYVLPDDVKTLAEPVLGHRLVPTTDARIRDRNADEILREILRTVPVPAELDT
jgi:MoxR-like ATPase